MKTVVPACIIAVSLFASPSPTSADEIKRITVIYDAFGAPSALQKDWGYAALVEYAGRRILFDTGNNAKIFEHNSKKLRIDLSRLDAVIISHRHGDHTSGLGYVLRVNPMVKIYTPVEAAFFKGCLPAEFLKPEPNLPPTLHYFDKIPPERLVTGTPWESANFENVSKTTEILPGFDVLTTQSQKPGSMEMNEASLAIHTARGLAVVVGCSHPGVEKILEQAAKIDSRLYTVTGGFHLVRTPREEIERVATVLHDRLKLARVAPGHCTSELGFAVFLERFKDHFDEAGIGAVIPLP